MYKKYLYALALFIVFLGGYSLGKYNNSQRYFFKPNADNLVILDSYTGTVHFSSGKTKKINP